MKKKFWALFGCKDFVNDIFGDETVLVHDASVSDHLPDDFGNVVSVVFSAVFPPFKLHSQALEHEADVSVVELVEAGKHLTHVDPLGGVVGKGDTGQGTLREEAALDIPRTANEREGGRREGGRVNI